MTRKDYELIAAALKRAIEDNPARGCRRWPDVEAALYEAAFAIAGALAADNPRFDRDRFLKACGLTLRQ